MTYTFYQTSKNNFKIFSTAQIIILIKLNDRQFGRHNNRTTKIFAVGEKHCGTVAVIIIN